MLTVGVGGVVTVNAVVVQCIVSVIVGVVDGVDGVDVTVTVTGDILFG